MTLPAIVILAVVCILIGIAVDSLLRNLPGDRHSSPLPPAPAAEQLPAELVSSLSADPPPNPPEEPLLPPPPQTSLEEVVHLWRDGSRQGLVVGMGGKIARSPEHLTAEQRSQLGLALADISAWLGNPIPSQPGIDSEQAAPLTPVSLPEAGEPSLLSTGGEDHPADRPSKNRPPLFGPFAVLTNALRAEVPKVASKSSLSLAGQVDEVLQEKLLNTSWEHRNIHLKDAPDGGLLVQVGMEKYNGVEEVPDEEIRQLIGASVEEWRKRMLPG